MRVCLYRFAPNDKNAWHLNKFSIQTAVSNRIQKTQILFGSISFQVYECDLLFITICYPINDFLISLCIRRNKPLKIIFFICIYETQAAHTQKNPMTAILSILFQRWLSLFAFNIFICRYCSIEPLLN